MWGSSDSRLTAKKGLLLHPDDPEHLFQPTVDRSHDIEGIDRPWNPWHLIVLTFFFGMLCGTILLVQNALRLGLRRQIPLVIVLGLILEVAALGTGIAVAKHFQREQRELSLLEQLQPASRDMPREGAAREGDQERPTTDQPTTTRDLESRKSTAKFFVRNGFNAAAVLLAMLLIIPQKRRFRLAETYSLPLGKLFLPALATIVVSVSIEIAVTVFVLLL